MLKVGGLFSGRHKAHGTTRSLNALDELNQIEDAMAAVTYIMNDDVDGAEEHLNKGNSPFHQLGKGVVTFMRATLGFEQDIMREASATLNDAENAAYDNQRRAHRTPHAYQSPIYPPGTEYAVCLAEAQLMSAIVGVLNESLTEAIKGFYKLRKAYLTLEGVMDAEKKFLRERSTSSLNSTGSAGSSRPGSRASARPGSSLLSPASRKSVDQKMLVEDGSSTRKEISSDHEDEDEDFDFVDAAEEHTELPTPQEYMGHLNVPAGKGASIELDNTKRTLYVESSSAPDLPSSRDPTPSVPEPIEDFEKLTLSDTIRETEDISRFADHPVDMFIVSGSNFCFGILLLLVSMVPPAFSTLLKIVGFKGDRERGIQMLWQATKYHNIHGAMAGLVLFGFYNGINGFCDIIPQSGEGSHPVARCKALLVDMRQRYPKSHLWYIEESRMLASDRKLEEAVSFIAKAPKSPLKQLEALGWFERSLNTMYLHEYDNTSAAFEKCVTLNNWSHGLYFYICGAAHTESYRHLKKNDPKAAQGHKNKAKEFFMMVAPNSGKKKFMARQLPFDVFTNRKIQKWEARAKEWSCDFIDAVGVSPLEEIIYFWNGYKRMRVDHLEVSLKNLAWSESEENPFWAKESLDEQAILALLRAAAFRNMGRTSEAKEVLQREIITHDRNLFKGHLRDNWTAPCARYEMAANVYREADMDARPERHVDLLEECKTWLLEVSNWESYDLDARIGMKVTTAKGTLRRYEIEI